MHYSVKYACARSDTLLYLEFEDGKKGVYDMSPVIGEGVFARLEDPEMFRQASSDGFTVTWPCGLDIAPEELCENCVSV